MELLGPIATRKVETEKDAGDSPYSCVDCQRKSRSLHLLKMPVLGVERVELSCYQLFPNRPATWTRLLGTSIFSPETGSTIKK